MLRAKGGGLGGPNEHLSIHWASRASDGILYPWAPPPSRPRVLAHHLHGSCECSRPSHSRWDPDKPAPHLKRSPPRRHVRGAGLRPGLLTPPTAGGRRSLVIALSGGDGGLRFHKAYRLHDFTRSPVPSGLHFLPNWPGVCQARRVFICGVLCATTALPAPRRAPACRAPFLSDFFGDCPERPAIGGYFSYVFLNGPVSTFQIQRRHRRLNWSPILIAAAVVVVERLRRACAQRRWLALADDDRRD